MSLSIANYLLYIGYMLASVAMAVLFSLTYLLITPVRELHLIKQGNVACALSFGGALIGFCLALASAMTHSLNILDFILWSAGAAVSARLTGAASDAWLACATGAAFVVWVIPATTA